uniref:Uncharacterized protein n=1 Tax=Rhizophora mucronata TaxID=61149 RepID=A0A2P2PWL5_RHIMU
MLAICQICFSKMDCFSLKLKILSKSINYWPDWPMNAECSVFFGGNVDLSSHTRLKCRLPLLYNFFLFISSNTCFWWRFLLIKFSCCFVLG